MAHIDRDKLLKDISESVVFSGRSGIPSAEVRDANKVIDRIKSAPAADVVEVVRCKDCVYRVPINERQFSYKGKPAMHCVIHSRLCSENEYCSYGERRETDVE